MTKSSSGYCPLSHPQIDHKRLEELDGVDGKYTKGMGLVNY